MIPAFEESVWEDYLWVQGNDKRIVRRLNRVIEDTLREPISGIGKPEALKGELAGYWSRRITEEHRLVYKVTDTQIIIASCRFHYSRR